MFPLFFTLFLLFQASSAQAVAISDSSTKNSGNSSTYSTLVRTKVMATDNYQNAIGLPVGSVIAWSGKANMTSYDYFKFLPCNGGIITRGQYPELYAVLKPGSGCTSDSCQAQLPNLNGDYQFLKGTTDASLVLKQYADTIKTYDSKVDEHTHTFDERLLSTALSGQTTTGTTEGSLRNTAIDARVKDPTLSGNLKNSAFTGTTQALTVKSQTATATTPSKSFNETITADKTLDIPEHTHTVQVSRNQSSYGYHSPGYGDLPLRSPATGSGAYTTSGTWFSFSPKSSSFSGALKNVKTQGTFRITVPAAQITGNLRDKSLSGGLVSSDVTGSLNNDDVDGYMVNGNLFGDRSHNTGVVNTKVTGEIYKKTNLHSYYDGRTADGRDEVAPRHTLVRYFIKAVP